MQFWQQLTRRARNTVRLASDEAARRGEHVIDCEHLLLAIIRLGDGTAVEILKSLKVNLSRLREDLRVCIDGAHEGDEKPAELHFTTSAQHALQCAYAETLYRQDEYIGTEHLLIGLLDEGSSEAQRMLDGYGLTSDRLRYELGRLRPAELEMDFDLRHDEEARPMPDMDTLSSERLPPPLGPYSQAVRAGGFIFCSGLIGVSPDTGKLVRDSFEAEVRQVMDNLATLLEDCGEGLTSVVKTTVFLVDLDLFPQFNEIYAEYFDDDPPARSTVEVAALPLGARIEVEAIALA